MGAIDFLLNLAGLLLWLSWRSMRFDSLIRGAPVSLVGTLKRAEPRQIKGWKVAVVLIMAVALRAIFYWLIGSPAEWTPKLNLELVVLAFRSDFFNAAFAFSCLSFLRALVVFYFWLLALAIINRPNSETDPIQKLVRLHLGGAARWPWPVQLLVPFLAVIALWISLQQPLVRLGVVAPSHSIGHTVEQGWLVGIGLLLSLKYLLPVILCLHLVASYVYLGSNPLWDFVGMTSANLTAPLRWLPLRLGKLDFTALVGAVLILFLLQWLPSLILGKLAASKWSSWPL
jgi:uncharacterized protein YggT (Ycf19 family)